MSVQRELPRSTPKGVFFLSFTFEYISTDTLVADTLATQLIALVRKARHSCNVWVGVESTKGLALWEQVGGLCPQRGVIQQHVPGRLQGSPAVLAWALVTGEALVRPTSSATQLQPSRRRASVWRRLRSGTAERCAAGR